MADTTLLANRYPGIVEAVFHEQHQAMEAKKALMRLELGTLPPEFERFTLIERRPVPQTAQPAGWWERLKATLGGRREVHATTPSHALPAVILLVRGEPARLQAAVKVLQEHGAHQVKMYAYGHPSAHE
ncbi:MAG: hypothetical protein Q9O62_13765 [Ardenticatenia bacterium]|nr:hypothetical protein [Ardenticatenia bacterium]